MNNVFVGEDIILPMSLRLQNALPYVAKTKISISPVGVGAPTTHFEHNDTQRLSLRRAGGVTA